MKCDIRVLSIPENILLVTCGNKKMEATSNASIATSFFNNNNYQKSMIKLQITENTLHVAYLTAKLN